MTGNWKWFLISDNYLFSRIFMNILTKFVKFFLAHLCSNIHEYSVQCWSWTYQSVQFETEQSLSTWLCCFLDFWQLGEDLLKIIWSIRGDWRRRTVLMKRLESFWSKLFYFGCILQFKTYIDAIITWMEYYDLPLVRKRMRAHRQEKAEMSMLTVWIWEEKAWMTSIHSPKEGRSWFLWRATPWQRMNLPSCGSDLINSWIQYTRLD